MKNWFQQLTGFTENSATKRKLQSILQDGTQIVLKGRTFECGRLEVPSLSDMRSRCTIPLGDTKDTSNRLTVAEIVGDVRQLHIQNPNALFQVASQFNLLEMVGPQVTPEHGVTIYEHDRTQGPACAMAVGAATLYRNYLIPMDDYANASTTATDGQIGQTESCQIDCLRDLHTTFQDVCSVQRHQPLWTTQNGYAFCTPIGESMIANYLNDQQQQQANMSYDTLMGQLRVGITWNASVTIEDAQHTVSQVFCSALPLAYMRLNTDDLEDFARLILDATYEATFYAALENYQTTNNPDVFLTYVGGGAFGNDEGWICDAIVRALRKFRNAPLRVHLVSYGRSSGIARKVIRKWAAIQKSLSKQRGK